MTIDPEQADKCFEAMGKMVGVDIGQMVSEGPWPTYVLQQGENMPEHIRRALIDDSEAALIVNEMGKVISIIVYGDFVGFRGMSVETMRQ